jgi:hypothetical protein
MAASSAQQELALFRLSKRLLGQARLQDFSGGLNLVAAPSELAQTETPDCMNVTLDERGGVVKRLGLSKIANHTSTTTQPAILYYSRALDKLMLQIGTGLYKSDDGGTNWSAALKTFSTSARVGMCDFLSKVVVIHPIDGAFTYDGATFSGKVTNSPNGNTIAVWQNALFSAGDPAQPSRVTRSDLGAITWPVTPITNDLRVKDDTAITALIAAGVNALLAFKEESIYRVQEATSIAYMTLSPTYGASGPLCVALNHGECAALSRRGIVVTDGMRNPAIVSDRIAPYFRFDQLAYSTSADWCAGVDRDRFVFSLARSGASANNAMLEYNPATGSIVPHSVGVQSFASYVPSTRRLLGAKVAADTHVATFDVFKGGTDDGSSITARFQTPWLELGGGYQFRLDHIRARGRGTFQVERRTDYAAAGLTSTFSSAPGGMLWNTGFWGSGLWGASLYESYNDFRPWQIARAISFVLSETSSTSASGMKLLGDGTASEVGDFACYGLELSFSQVELP